jgi:hypothetical protein
MKWPRGKATLARIASSALVLAALFWLVASWFKSVYIVQSAFNANVWNSYRYGDASHWDHASDRQHMISDLIARHLPRKSKAAVVELLGVGNDWADPTRQREWDLSYEIGVEQIFIWDHRWVQASPNHEHLLIRVGDHGFCAWTIDGSSYWKWIATRPSLVRYQELRERK